MAANRNDREIEDLAGYKTGVVIAGKWKILELLDEGGFGKVYRVQDTSMPNSFAALKIESMNMEGGSAIKLEKTALSTIHKARIRNHVPQLYRSSRRKNICYMIITLLGDSLRRIKDRYYPNGYPLKLWVKVAVQCLYAIKVVHDAGFVHRDIKAANFVFGHGSDPKKARVVHIIDFGLARQYALEDAKRRNAYRPRQARPHTDFRGTWNFASPAMHDYVELGRKDDLWSLLFMLMDLYATLPWANLDTLEAIGKMKQNMRVEDMMIKMPIELLPVPKHLRTLDVYNRPNYRMVYEALDKIFVRCKASWTEPYEWENKDMAARNLLAQQSTGAAEYMDPGPFFQEDPIHINTGPSKFVPDDNGVTLPSNNRSVAIQEPSSNNKEASCQQPPVGTPPPTGSGEKVSRKGGKAATTPTSTSASRHL